MKFLADLVHTIRNYPETVADKVAEFMVSYVTVAMICIFMSGASMNSGSAWGTILFLLAALAIYVTKGNPVKWFYEFKKSEDFYKTSHDEDAERVEAQEVKRAEPWKPGDWVVCLDISKHEITDVVEGNLYQVERREVEGGLGYLRLVGSRGWWSESRFRTATAEEIAVQHVLDPKVGQALVDRIAAAEEEAKRKSELKS